jgi:hypothetical protein
MDRAEKKANKDVPNKCWVDTKEQKNLPNSNIKKLILT